MARLRHKEPLLNLSSFGGIIFNAKEDSILSWSDDTVKLLHLNMGRKLKSKYYSLEREVESGAYLSRSGEVKALSKEKWLKKKEEYERKTGLT